MGANLTLQSRFNKIELGLNSSIYPISILSTPNFVRANKIILKYNKNKNVCYYLNKKYVLILFYFMNKVKIKFVKKEKK